MGKKAAFALIFVIIVGFGAAWFFYPPFRDFFTNLGDDLSCQFDPGERYDSTQLNYMDVIFVHTDNITAVNEAYSNTANCPWGFKHEGFDFFFANNSRVIAAAPGQVERIETHDWGADKENRYTVNVQIRFNCSAVVNYHFESWTAQSDDWEHQKAIIGVKEGDWVSIGQEIGHMLSIGPGAHIHFDVVENNERHCLTQYYSAEAYQKMTDLIHLFHPDWELCYIE
jgi:hypothetical protein